MLSNMGNGKHREQSGFRSNRRTILRGFFFSKSNCRTDKHLHSSADLVKSTKHKSLFRFQGTSHSPSLPAYLVHTRIRTCSPICLCVCFYVLYVLYVPPVPVWVFFQVLQAPSSYSQHWSWRLLSVTV